ncbi:hypothetical protein BHE74_00037831 [Ensete ventricosum]|nr:hypothetical protein BHE74_00037831 [Ensete ventricosum]
MDTAQLLQRYWVEDDEEAEALDESCAVAIPATCTSLSRRGLFFVTASTSCRVGRDERKADASECPVSTAMASQPTTPPRNARTVTETPQIDRDQIGNLLPLRPQI